MPDAIAIEAVGNDRQLEEIAVLARQIWRAHYPGIISREQIDHMLRAGYALSAMRADIDDGVSYALACRDGQAVGFAAYGPDADGRSLWLHKLYVEAAQRRGGIAKRLLQGALEHARELGVANIRLRVNRRNEPAIAAYRRLGFEIEGFDVKHIGGGFVMDDYLMLRRVEPG